MVRIRAPKDQVVRRPRRSQPRLLYLNHRRPSIWLNRLSGFARHVKLTFGRGTALKPVPLATSVGMGKHSRGVELESLHDLNERQAASWMKQATAIPGFGKRK